MLQLIKCWGKPEDELIFAFNQGHPCREQFVKEAGAFAQIAIVKEELLQEKRLRFGDPTSRSWRQSFSEFLFDFLRPFQFLGALVRFRRFLRAQAPDVLIVSTGGNPPNDFSWRLLLAARWARTSRVILTLHNLPGQGTNWLRRAAIGALRRLTPRLCDAIVVPAQAVGRLMEQSMELAKPPVCIFYGIDPLPTLTKSLAEKALELNLSDGYIQIGAIGNLQERKGFSFLIEAMPSVLQTYPQTRLTIIGQDIEGYRHELTRLMATLGLTDKVRLAGFLPNAGEYWECFDIAVVPSIAFECLPYVAIEAMRLRKPVVAAATAGLPEIVSDQETGYVVPARNAAALAQAMTRLLQSPEQRLQMGRAGHARFLNLFTTDRMLRGYHDLTL